MKQSSRTRAKRWAKWASEQAAQRRRLSPSEEYNLIEGFRIHDLERIMNKSERMDLERQLDLACNLLCINNFGFLCEEQVIFVRDKPMDKSRRTIASYNHSSGNIRFYAGNIRGGIGSPRVIRTMIHELGHKISHEYPELVDFETRKEVFEAYFHFKEEASRLWGEGSLESVEDAEEMEDAVNALRGFFVSWYGRTNEEEMMAEAFSAWIAPDLYAREIGRPQSKDFLEGIDDMVEMLDQYLDLRGIDLDPPVKCD